MATIYNQGQQTGGAYLGTVTFPDTPAVPKEPQKEASHPAEKDKEEPHDSASKDAGAPSSPPEPAVSPTPPEPAKVVEADAPVQLAALRGLVSPLALMRAYKGARTLKTMGALVAPEPFNKSGVEQFPPIAVSDGATMVTVRISFDSRSFTPRFSLKGAKLLAIRRPTEKTWEMDIVPAKGAYDVQVSLLAGKEYADVPLFVVPPLSPLLAQLMDTMNDAAVDALLAKSGGTQAVKPPYDMNGDGKQDYVDDYILIGHHLRKTLKKSTSKADKR